ncbi:MAG TPA: hypothetical protein VIH99_12120 [Bdellovibrionota bacterium]|jgi:hypothetical protein
MKRIIFSVMVLGILGSALPAQAREIPGLTRFVSQEISTMSRAVEGSSAGGEATEGPDYFFKRFMVRVRASMGFDVPWIASFQVVPEVELVWYRSMPK